MIDFSKRLGKKTSSKPSNPIELYETLDIASDKGPLRPAQIAILSEWHEKKRNERDLIVKLHTGQGKTLIGLLILQSKINEGCGPALYVCPNRFLVKQTCEQATQFGIPFCTDDGDLPEDFLNADRLLVTTVQKLFNGQSKFRMGPKSLPVEAIVMDDAHACVDSIRDSSVIRLERTEPAYQKILDLFLTPLEHQGAGTLADIRNGEYEALLPVPYWAWQERQGELVEILSEVARRPATGTKKPPHDAWYKWPLIKDDLSNCQCVISGHGLEIAPYLAPVGLFGSYSNAKHRVFMSATVTNDAFLVKGLRLAPDTIKNPLVFKGEKWSGEKMILIPSLINSALDRVMIVNQMAKPKPKRTFGVVALTPSFAVARFWETCGASVATTDTIDAEIEKLKSGDCETVLVMASRYDGVDLPDSACRVLIFDSLPIAQNLIDAYADSNRGESQVTALRIARMVEQGLGRSVRGERDYCAIVMIGPELVRMVRSQRTRRLLSDQTTKQIQIGLEIAEMLKAEASSTDPYDAFINLLNQCLRRDSGWKQFYAEQMDEIVPSTPSYEVLDIFELELQAELAFQGGGAKRATEIIQDLIDKHVKDDSEKGWYLQEMARYAMGYSRSAAEKLQMEAHSKNHHLMRPATGMKFEQISAIAQKRTANILEWVSTFENYEELRLAADEVLGRLEFGVKADRFEDAVYQLGKILGFGSQRPEKEWKEGPDNLWAVKEGEYILIECKSEVLTTRVEMNKAETGQMNNACAWFERNYPGAKATNVIVIPTKKISAAGGFNEPVYALRKANLASLVSRVRKFLQEFAGLEFGNITEGKVQELLTTHALDLPHILSRFEPTLHN